MNEDKIIHLCQVISHWVTQRGEATVRREKGIFDAADKQVKRWVKELEERVKNE
jgi:hypothetical protein